jgi:hypothetical protein
MFIIAPWALTVPVQLPANPEIIQRGGISLPVLFFAYDLKLTT